VAAKLVRVKGFASAALALSRFWVLQVAGFVWFQGWNDMYGGAEKAYHYMGSAIWFNRIGHAMGEAMLDLMADGK